MDYYNVDESLGSMMAEPTTLDKIKGGLGKVGQFMSADRIGKLTPLLPAFQDFGTNRFGQTLAGIAQNMATARANAKIQGRMNPAGQPSVQSPTQPTPQQPPLKSVTTKTEYMDLNQNGIPDSEEQAPAQTPKIGGNKPFLYDPAAMPGLTQGVAPGPAVSAQPSFSEGVGNQPVGMPTSIARPTPAAPSPVEQYVPSVQNLNKEDISDLMTIGGNFGYPAAAASTKEVLDRGVESSKADSAAVKARADMLEASIKNRGFATEMRAKGALANYHDAQVEKMYDDMMKSTPDAIRLAEYAKQEGQEAAKLAAVMSIAKTPQGQTLVAEDLGFPKNTKYADLYYLFGDKAPEVLKTAMTNRASIKTAGIEAGGRVAAAKVADTTKRVYLDTLRNSINTDQLRLKEYNDNYYNPAEVKPNEATMLSAKGLKPMTPQTLNDFNILTQSIKVKAKQLDDAMRFYGEGAGMPSSYAPTEAVPRATAAPTSITVGGQTIKGTMQPDGSFKGDNGKTYKQK